MSRKDLISSKEYLEAMVECYLFNYRQAKNKEEKLKVEKKLINELLEHRKEYLELNKTT